MKFEIRKKLPVAEERLGLEVAVVAGSNVASVSWFELASVERPAVGVGLDLAVMGHW